MFSTHLKQKSNRQIKTLNIIDIHLLKVEETQKLCTDNIFKFKVDDNNKQISYIVINCKYLEEFYCKLCRRSQTNIQKAISKSNPNISIH